MIVSPLLFKTTAAPAERGGRRERPVRPAMKAGRTRRVGTKWRTRQGLRPAGRASEESDRPPRTAGGPRHRAAARRSEEPTSELQSLMSIYLVVFYLKIQTH